MINKTLERTRDCLLHAKKVDCLGQAAILSYTTMFSIVPLLFIITSILNVVVSSKDIRLQVETFMLSHLSVINSDLLVDYIRSFLLKAHELSPLGILFLLISGLFLFLEIESAFDKIWELKKSRYGWLSVLLYGATMTVIPVMFAVTIYLEVSLVNTIVPASVYVILLTITVFTAIFKVFPSCEVKLKSALFSAIVSSFMFVMVKHMFIFYFSTFNNYNILYGVFSALPIFMLWIYLSWLIILFGAVIAYVSSKY